MNKVLFLIITMTLFIALIFASDYISGRYLLSEYYVPTADQELIAEDAEAAGAMPLNEYLEILENGEEIDFEDVSQFPIEIQMIQFKSYLLRIVVFALSVTLSIFAIFVIKSNTIEFSVLALDSGERIINMARIALYMIVLTAAYMAAQTYPLKFLLGWVRTVLWTVCMMAVVVWILNIIHALKERRKFKAKPLKPSRG